MIETKARQLIPGDFCYDPDCPLWAVRVSFLDTDGNEVFFGGNPLVAVATEAEAVAYGESVILPDLLSGYAHKLANFVPQPEPIEPEGV